MPRRPTGRLSRYVWPITGAAVAVLILRLVLGAEWLLAGWEKLVPLLSDPHAYIGGMVPVLTGVWVTGTQTVAANPYPFMSDFLVNFVGPNASLILPLVAVGESVVGVLLILGLLSRPALAVGAFMNVLFFLAAGHTSVSTSSLNVLMVGVSAALFVVSAGRAYGLDAALKRRFQGSRVF